MKHSIHTPKAPAAIGCYSQAIKTNQTIYLSGQVPLDPVAMTIVEGGIRPQIVRVFENLKAVAEAAGGNLDAVVKLTIYLTDIANLTVVNELMAQYFLQPYPARTSFAVVGLPKESLVEVDAIMEI